MQRQRLADLRAADKIQAHIRRGLITHIFHVYGTEHRKAVMTEGIIDHRHELSAYLHFFDIFLLCRLCRGDDIFIHYFHLRIMDKFYSEHIHSNYTIFSVFCKRF